MRTVIMRLPAADLSGEMVAMRGWLDSNRYELTRFDCDQNGDDIIVSVDFSMDAAAAAFAKRFDGPRVTAAVTATAHPDPRNRPPPA